MTKKDYILIAKSISNTIDYFNANLQSYQVLTAFSDILSSKLKAENPKFNRSKFIDRIEFFTKTGKYQFLSE